MESKKHLSLKKGLVKVLTDKEAALVAGGQHGVHVDAAANTSTDTCKTNNSSCYGTTTGPSICNKNCGGPTNSGICHN